MLPVTKFFNAAEAFFDSKTNNVYEVAPTFLNGSHAVKTAMFTVCVHYISIVAEQGLQGLYVNDPVMEQNANTARQMMGDTFD
jgi:hypothetical protein